jgi:hypothetical protein
MGAAVDRAVNIAASDAIDGKAHTYKVYNHSTTAAQVLVDVDENDGDDDVFVVSVTVEAPTPAEAMTLGEAKAVARYGKDNVLGAWDARELA